MEIVVCVLWITLGIFVIVKRGATPPGASGFIGTIVAVLFFVGLYLCYKVILFTGGSLICFITAPFLLLLLVFYSIHSDESKNVIPSMSSIWGFILVPLCFVGEVLKSISEHEINEWSVFAYMIWICVDVYLAVRSHEIKQRNEKTRQEAVQECQEAEDSLTDSEPYIQRVWENGRFVEKEIKPDTSDNTSSIMK